MDVAIVDGVDVLSLSLSLSLSLGGFPLPLFDDSITIGSFRAVKHGISHTRPKISSHSSDELWRIPLWRVSVPGNRLPRRNLKWSTSLAGKTEVNFASEGLSQGQKYEAKWWYVICERGERKSRKSRPRARIIFGGTVIGRSRAPAVAQFSARGPSLYDPSILKPDVIAPGVNIIAAWPQNLGPTALPEDASRVNFTVISGTSMACPHVSRIAALIHSAHAAWTPAAIKSAIMTSADANDNRGKPIMDGNKSAAIFAVGAGHVNPDRAIDRGLIYDIRPNEYVIHLCSIGYTRSEIFTITHRTVSCSKILQMNKGSSLNSPSISVAFKQGMKSKTITRRLTNVGSPNSEYSVKVKAPEGVKVRVKPHSNFYSVRSLSYRIWVISRNKQKQRG
ncbi:hypothetical protein DITRI_Ditri13aG0108600 [Diplodiscus trichospermus]